MHRFLSAVVIFFALQAGIMTAAVAYYKRDMPDPNDFVAAYADKEALLARTPSRRIIFIGGSNVPLGIDSEEVARSLPSFHPVDMGLISGLGFEMMRAQIEPAVGHGDVVVISLEYERWVYRFHALTVLRVLDYDPGAWRQVPLGYLPGLLDAGLGYVGEIVRQDRRKLAGRSLPPTEAPYLRSGINRFGDETLQRDIRMDPRVRLGRAEIDALANLSESHVREMVDDMNAFHRRMIKRGALVFLTYPAVTPDIYREWREQLKRLDGLLRARLTVPLLDSPDEVLYPRAVFTDHIYHLNSEGIDLRMRHLMRRLTARLRAAGIGGSWKRGVSAGGS
jgi:hypothetical protein